MKSLLLSALAAICLSTAAAAGDPASTSPAKPPATTPAAAPKTTTPATPRKPQTFHVADGKAMHKGHMKMVGVDLNTASKDDLMKVKGITDSMADKIVQDRPFTNKHDLVTKQIMTQAEYSKVKGLVMVKATPAPKKP